jgi:queuosine precursor transporter
MLSNELVLLLHASAIVGLVFLALKLGKSALICFIALCGILANLLVLKQVDLFGLHVTCTDVFMIGQLIGLNVLQEYYNAEDARDAISVTFFAALSSVVLGFLHLAYIPNAFDTTHNFYATIFMPVPRILLASILIDFLSAHIERIVYTKLSILFEKRFFGLRNIITMSISQTFDTVAFSYLGLYGLIESVPHIIISSLIIKGLLIVGMSLLSSGTRAALSKE